VVLHHEPAVPALHDDERSQLMLLRVLHAVWRGEGIAIVGDLGDADIGRCHLDASAEGIALPLGLGSRHLAAASISHRLGIIAIVVSESSVVRVFHRGEIEPTLIPELWLLDRHHAQLAAREPISHHVV
jgi:hypothetical protein